MLLTVIVSVLLIGLDQWTKDIAARSLAPNGSHPLIPGVIELRYTENTGAAFSFFSGRQMFLIVITGIALLVLAFILLFRRPKGKLEYIALLLIFSGGMGNLIDRIIDGYVVDFFNLLFMNFAVFNVADCLLSVGFVLLFIGVVREEIRNKKEKKKPAEPAPPTSHAPDGQD